MAIDLKHLQLDDILSRLGEKEKNICVLDSATNEGWKPVVAWNPIDTFQLNSGEIEKSINNLEKFVVKQKKAGHLVVGFMSYDYGALLHSVKLTKTDDLLTPLVFVAAFDNWINFNSESNVHASSSNYEDEVKNIMARQPRELLSKTYSTTLSPSWSRDSYNDAYVRVKKYIKAGDIYQVNLTHRLEGTSDLDAIDIYRKVLKTSQASFQSFIKTDDFEIISASPERFVRISNNTIETTPIKGTRPRGHNSSEDKALRIDLETSPKDRAELDMITDLMRNDLGEISEIGSVQVISERILKSYPTLWHAHSVIQGKLRSDISPIAALASLMPGGSITGCPKKRAIEIIDELEDKRRGVYTGSIFTIAPNGDLDSNIAIRTMIKKQEKVYLSVGGGIVYDSKRDDEYDESLQKAAVFLNL